MAATEYPREAINLAEALGHRCQTSAVEALSARILSALDWARAMPAIRTAL